MPQAYLRKNDNGRKAKSYRQTLLEQNIWRCDCSDEGQHTAINRHESNCRYGAWYVENDLHKGDNDTNDTNESQ